MGNKVAIVTGSSKGIGKAIALAFAKSKEYSAIVINSRKVEEAQEVSKEVKKLGCNSTAIGADVSKESDCIRLIEETVKHFGRIDVLVNNAGIQDDLPLTEINLEEWYKIIGVDLTGPFICSREDVHQAIPKPHYVPYATSKAGIEMMTKTLALELAKDNIRANIVAPGAIDTDMNVELRENKAELQSVLKRIPLGRVASADEVANVGVLSIR
jgi:glucose 1-dehydrogenase